MSERADMLREAAELIDGDRNNEYGDPLDDFGCTAVMWQAYLDRIGIRDLQPHDVAAMMVLVKISRISESPKKRDHWVDVAGYSACGGDVAQREPAAVCGACGRPLKECPCDFALDE